jgi:hypothetical protein
MDESQQEVIEQTTITLPFLDDEVPALYLADGSISGFHASSQPTHVDQEVQFFLEVNIPLNIGSRSVQMRGRHSAVKIHMNDRMHALLLASGKLSRQRILLDSDALNRHTSKRRVSIHHQAVGWPFPPW